MNKAEMKKKNFYGGFSYLIETAIKEKPMLIPSDEKFLKFIEENDFEKKEIIKETPNATFSIVAYYINGELLQLSADAKTAEGKEKNVFSGVSTSPRFAPFVQQLADQLNINL